MSNLLAHNLSGPRRFGYGTIRDYVIGLKVHLADGRTIKTGGKVVKNVAGYDLQKLFIGAEHSLGTIVEATFKLRPRPEMEQFVSKQCAGLGEAEAAIAAVLDSPLAPIILDLHNVNTNSPCVVLGVAGTPEDVEWQMSSARALGFLEPANLDYDAQFWADQPNTIQKTSVLPSKLFDAIAAIGNGRFMARAGNGILYYRGAPAPPGGDPPHQLFLRAREAFASVR